MNTRLWWGRTGIVIYDKTGDGCQEIHGGHGYGEITFDGERLFENKE